jgi:lipopolysaccharide transport system ATP-binding protein
MSDIAIRAEGLSKRYRIGQREPYKALRDVLADALYAPFRAVTSTWGGRQQTARENPSDNYIWALKDVSFEIRQGEVVGIIGRNGAGKTTLLKILSRITRPTKGYAEIHGRVGSLLEVGTGFHPELTGRENIYLNGAILGMKRAEIDRKFDEIVAFAEIEKFLDTPVKRYSSGMYVRLAFAVAAHLEPEILLVDEVLAVGDAAFQKKCLGKMGEVAREGRTVLFVSHNMAAITRLCPRALVLDSGACTFQGSAPDAINYYLQSGGSACRSYVDLRKAPGWDTNRRVILTWISTHRLDGTESSEFNTGDGMIVRIGYHLDGKILAYCQINILNYLGERLITLRSTHSGPPLEISGDGVIQCTIPDIRLASGEYIIMPEIGRQFPQPEWLDCVPEATRFRVNLGDYLGGFDLARGQGIIAQRSEWSVASVETDGPGERTWNL